MKLKQKLYYYLIKKNKVVDEQYRYYCQNQDMDNKIRKIMLILRINLWYLLKYRKLKNNSVSLLNQHSGIQENRLYNHLVDKSESEFNKEDIDFENIICMLEGYDVISFDIFDTLIFRKFDSPITLFYMLSHKYNYLDFASIREKMENQARINKFDSHKSYEINIYDIYEQLEKYAGIKASDGIEEEILNEIKICYENPYMSKVFKRLIESNKTVILTSDMYLPANLLKRILTSCNYKGYDKLYVSCDYGKSKIEGSLFEIIKKEYKNKKIIHIGDNKISDINRAKEHNIDAIYYPNVNKLGNRYRTMNMSCIIGSGYRGIVNAKLYSGLSTYSPIYEYGYTYGGILVLGYCNYIYELSKKNKIDKILFLSRDGDVIKKVYDYLFPNENTEYVYWSRNIATLLTATKYKYDYLKRFIWDKINCGFTIEEVCNEIDACFLLEDYKFDKHEHLTNKNQAAIESLIIENWEEIVARYEAKNEGAKRYYNKVLSNYKNVYVIDTGWAGSGAISLEYLVNDVWELDCKITGLLIGTNDKASNNINASEAQICDKRLISYVFSQNKNRDIWKGHNSTNGDNIFMELLFSSPSPSLLSIDSADNAEGYSFEFANKNIKNDKIIREIQSGILEFVRDYHSAFKEYPFMFNISGADAYAPFQYAMNNRDYFKSVFKDVTFDIFLGDSRREKIEKLIP